MKLAYCNLLLLLLSLLLLLFCRVLRDTVESNETEIAHLRRRCDALNNELHSINKDHAMQIKEKNQELSDLHAELKMKSFQFSSLGVTFEVRLADG